MQDALVITTAIAVLFFIGIACSWIGDGISIPISVNAFNKGADKPSSENVAKIIVIIK